MWNGGLLPIVSKKECGNQNIAVVAIIKIAKKRRDNIIEQLKKLNSQFNKIDTIHGDEADRSANETSIRENTAKYIFLQKQLLRINTFIDTLSSPEYDGHCNNELCCVTIPLKRIMNTFSPLCINCAQ